MATMITAPEYKVLTRLLQARPERYFRTAFYAEYDETSARRIYTYINQALAGANVSDITFGIKIEVGIPERPWYQTNPCAEIK